MTLYVIDKNPAQNMWGIGKSDFLEIQIVLEKGVPKNKKLLSGVAMTIAAVSASIKPRGCVHVSFA